MITVLTDFDGVLAAILAWAETYTGLGAGKVTWRGQMTRRPARPYATLHLFQDGAMFGLDEQRDTPPVVRTFLPADVDVFNNLITLPGHQLAENQLVRATSSGALPLPLGLGTDYYARPLDLDRVFLSTTPAGPPVDLLDPGTGTHTLAGFMERTTTGLRRCVVTLQTYSETPTAAGQDSAGKMLQRALASLGSEPVLEAFRAVNLAYVDHQGAVRLDEQLGERWERRASADIELLYPSAVKDDRMGWVETVDAVAEANASLTISQ